jgi:hypothetical protein
VLQVVVVESTSVRLVRPARLLLAQNALLSHCRHQRLVVLLVELHQRISTISRWNSLAEMAFSGS